MPRVPLISFILLILLLACFKVNSQTNKLINAIEKLPNELRAEFVKDQVKELYKRDSADARKQINELLSHYKSDKSIMANIYLSKGAFLYRESKTEDALVALTKAEKLFVELKQEEAEYTTIGLLISVYRELNRSNEITAIIIKKLRQSENNFKRECTLLQRLGLIFKDQSNYTKSLEYFELAREKFDMIKEPTEKDKELQISIERNMGVLYRNNNDLDKALFHFNKALALAEINHSDNLKAAVLNSLGTLYKLRKEYYKAIQAYEESLKIKSEQENMAGLSTTCTNLSALYLEINNYVKAEVFALKAYEYGVVSKERTKIMNACEKVANVYEKMHKLEKAFPYLNRAYHLQDSMYKGSIAEQSAKLEAQYDSEKKKKEIELSKLKNQQLQESVKARSRERNMILMSSLVLVILLVFAVKSYLDKRKANNLLNDKNNLIVTQKQMVEEQHKEILDSINYAKRLQDAILPQEAELNSVLSEYFIYYCPKSIVAGDFYWMEVFDNLAFIAVADCTGHGVPGAMVSLVCSNALNRSVYEYGIREPGKILDRTRELVLENFVKSKSDVKDGMDISLLSINRVTNEVKWAGANNPLWYIKEGTFFEITANKQPIGKSDSYKSFHTHSLSLGKGDSLFLFTDGYADQFGGPRGKKLKYKQMQEIITLSHTLPMVEVSNEVRNRFEKWKGDLEQVDDVCVVGIRL